MDFEFEIDELTLVIVEGATTTVTTGIKVYATAGCDETVIVDQIDIFTDESKWVRIDDEPQFKAWEDAVKLVADKYFPDLPSIDPNAEHRLLACELV